MYIKFNLIITYRYYFEKEYIININNQFYFNDADVV